MPPQPVSVVPLPSANKAVWRAWARARRAELLAQMPALSDQIAGQLTAFLQGLGVHTVLAYHALPGEPDVSALQSDFRLLTTRAHFGPPRFLSLHPWESATEQSKQGIWQPPLGTPAAALSEVEAVLLPALAFDRRGVRLGYGGGFYDRLLAGWPGLTIGVLPAELLVAALPAEAHDVRARFIATQAGCLAAAL